MIQRILDKLCKQQQTPYCDHCYQAKAHKYVKGQALCKRCYALLVAKKQGEVVRE